MRELSGRTAFVTGAGSGIGRGIALALAAERMQVAVADIDAASAERVASEITGRGGRAFAVAVDVTSQASLDAAAAEVAARAGGVHLLVNNAGVMPPLGPLVERSDADWHYVFDVNVYGPVRGVRAFLSQLRANAPEAQIVNTASLGGLVPVPDVPVGVYVASKYACVGYSESLRLELAPEGIGVSILCPGTTRSNLMATSARNRPARFGGPEAAPLPPPAPPELEAVTLDPEALGPMVVRGIRENRLYIVTHPEWRGEIERRSAAILADIDAEARARSAR